MELSVKAGDTVTVALDNDRWDDLGKTYTIENIQRYGISSTGVMVKFVGEALPRIISAGALIKV
jgi:hypothetical protein